MDKHVYVGPCVRLPKVSSETTETIYGCSKEDCENSEGLRSDMAYCPICGSKGKKRGVLRRRNAAPNWYSFSCESGLDPEVFAAMESNGQFVLVPNRANMGGRTYSKWDETKAAVLTAKLIESETEAFEKAFSQYAEAFEKRYGMRLKAAFESLEYWL